MVSGSGSNLQAMIDACAAGSLQASIVGVVSNRSAVLALERAARHGIATTVLTLAEARAKGLSREDYDEMLAQAVLAYRPDLVIMAGFMHIVSCRFMSRFPDRMFVNVHPSLLPDDPRSDVVELPDGTKSPVFRGHDAPAQALRAGVRWTGTSVHYVMLDVDRGPLLAREAVPIEPGDTVETLQKRIQAVEHRLYPATVARVLEERKAHAG
jgi:phosphoribosylglycinamide formyltransferase-1